MTVAPELQLTRRAANLQMSAEGLWVAPGDVDLDFLSDDATDWVEIEGRSFWYQYRNEIILDVLTRFPYRGWLFEVGAGNGAVCAAIQTAGLPVVAIEPTVSWARNARRRGLDHVVCAHLQKAEFSKGALDNVAMFDVLEHIDDDAAFLSELRRLMPIGGRLYLAVPAFNALWSHEDERSGHHRRYKADQMGGLLHAAGFRQEFSTYFFLPLVPAILVGRSLPYRLGIHGERTHESSAADHGLNETGVVKVLRAMLQRERSWIGRKRTLPIGSSILSVAVAVEH